jgi:DNA-binding transcriptional LysR family regulator
MVAAGVGLAIIPELVAHRMMNATSIVPIPLTDAWATRRLSLCIRSLDELTSSARALIDHLSEERPLDSENFPTI